MIKVNLTVVLGLMEHGTLKMRKQVSKLLLLEAITSLTLMKKVK